MHPTSRLITSFVPTHYQLYLDLKRHERTFTGITTITGTTHQGVTRMVFHAKGLRIESITLDGKAAEWREGHNDELTVLHPHIHEGEHVVVIAYSGHITDAMHGLYPCYYTHDGHKKELLATQFESHHAREVFPCIDEPEAKATFDVTLVTEKGVTVLGNMPVQEQTIEAERLVTTFDTTPRMSTYLVAWVAGELHKKSATTKNGTIVTIWATPAQSQESLTFALDTAVRTIEFFNDYFGTPYPLPKSDHVALPDFGAGAMENWGLITYREATLLADPVTSSIASKHRIAVVIAHELSHQWFGNLVTMKWWDNLWLNESFATLMEYIAVDALYPEWNIWLDFATTESILALHRDSLSGVQPVQTAVNHPDEVYTLFDPAIMYAKGARLLRMLQRYIGNSAFRAGLKTYFATHAYSNTEGDDLWQALGGSSHKDIAHFMHAWISQSGYPVVELAQRDTQLTIRQRRFLVGSYHPSDTVWPVPLHASDEALPKLLDTQETTIPYQATAPLRLNVGDSAHFITHYEPDLLTRLIEDVKHATLNPLDRLQLLHEQILLTRGGIVSSASLIPLLSAYTHETTEPVWDMISLAINELKKFVETSKPAEQSLRKLARDLADEQYSTLGWLPKQDEPETNAKLRATIIGLVLYSEDTAAINIALDTYASSPLEQLNPELRPLMIGTAVRHMEHPEHVVTNLLKTHQTTHSAALRDDIASGLSSTHDQTIITRLLTLLKDSSVIRRQDTVRWVVRLFRNRYARELTWQWLQNNWSWINETFGGDKSYDYFPRYAASALVNRRQLNEYTHFFTPLQTEPALARVITIGIGEITGRVELIERDAKAVQHALLTLP